jgi:ankyrin repeat protein
MRLERESTLQPNGPRGNDTTVVKKVPDTFSFSLFFFKVLLDHGADINLSEEIDDDCTALMIAAEMGHESIVRMLLAKGADVTYRSRLFPEKDAAEHAAENGHHKIADLIRQRSAEIARRKTISNRKRKRLGDD